PEQEETDIDWLAVDGELPPDVESLWASTTEDSNTNDYEIESKAGSSKNWNSPYARIILPSVTDTKINETWNSCKKLRETYEAQIENFQQDLLKWLQKINKTIRQGNKNFIKKENDNDMFFQEKQESLKCLEEKMNELQNTIEQKFSKSTLEGLFNYEFSQLKKLVQDSADADETTTDDTSELDLMYEDVPLQLCQDNR
ncbi:1177_t:CDS:2, partial [Racocetra persica]